MNRSFAYNNFLIPIGWIFKAALALLISVITLIATLAALVVSACVLPVFLIVSLIGIVASPPAPTLAMEA